MSDRADELTSDAITADFRVLQRRRGHRYSLDDVLTAALACRARRETERALDLGTGIGSVLTMVAWKLPRATLVGIEAQEVSYELLERNVEANRIGDRVRTIFGDFRDEETRRAAGGPFDLVTGTPPYFPPGTASVSPDPQRAHARVELRGGVEDYLDAAGALLTPEGVAVVCAAAGADARVERGARAAGLHVGSITRAIPRRGKAPLFSVFVLERESAEAPHEEHFVAREADGTRSAEYHALRAFFGLTQREDPA